MSKSASSADRSVNWCPSPHRGLQLAQPIPHPVSAPDGGAITRRDVLGGTVHEYDRVA